jgi:hypothetical protein
MARIRRLREGKPQISPLAPGFPRDDSSAHLPSFQQPLLRKSATLPFVISTGAQRSGEICGSAVLLGNVLHLLGDFQRNDHARLDAMARQGRLPQDRARGIRGVRRSHSRVRVCGSVRIATLHRAHLESCVHY